jgi:RimJ/RimL family protein N-acetyltransferase
MIGFSFLEKSRAAEFAPALFDLMYENMRVIAPTGKTREEDYAEWSGEVLPALQKDARKVLLIRDGGTLIGFVQYYTNPSVFMIEEAQLTAAYQNTGVMRRAFCFLASEIPAEIPFIEAFVHRENARSQAVLGHLGFAQVGTIRNGAILHFRRKGPSFIKRLRQTE